MNFTHSLESTIKTDVLVVGGGAAGICAAAAAARTGAETLLIEKLEFLGGLSATMPWIGFHDRDYQQVVRGLGDRFVRKLQEAGAASEYCFDPKCSSVVSVDNHVWKCVALEQLERYGVKVRFGTAVIDALREGDRVTGVVVADLSGLRRIEARTVVDCSGNGEVAAKAGFCCEKGRKQDGLVQTPSIGIRLGGLDYDAFIAGVRDKKLMYRDWLSPYPDLWDKAAKHLARQSVILFGGYETLVAQARSDGAFDLPQTHVIGVKLHRRDQFYTVMARVRGFDPTDVENVNATLHDLYRQIPQLLRFFRDYVPGFGNSYLLESAPMLCVREGRRIVGDRILTLDDLLSEKHDPETIALGGYHVDIHRPVGAWVESIDVPCYSIPRGCLIAAGTEGLLMAGKCLSASHEAIASARVVPICMATGEAAGSWAGQGAVDRKDLRDIPYHRLREHLIRYGAELGQSLSGPNLDIIEQFGQMPRKPLQKKRAEKRFA